MQAFDLLIRNGRTVTEDGVHAQDVGIRDGAIVALEESLKPDAREIIDAKELIVTPGGIDTHVHLEQPSVWGAEPSDTFATATASAAIGGTTTVVCFAWQTRGQSIARIVEDYSQKARKSRIDYAFHMTITDPTRETLQVELPRLIEAGNRSIKIFMAYDGTCLNDCQILDVLEAARRCGALVCVHAENNAIINYMTTRLLNAGLTAPKYFPWAKPMVAEREAVQRVIALAEVVDVPIHVFHVSGEEPAAEIERAQKRGVKVTAETCPQYLNFVAEDLDQAGFEGAKLIFGPPPRTRHDQDALWDYLRRGVISTISSDHSPTNFNGTSGKKIAGENAPFSKVPNGIPGVGARLPLLFSQGVSGGRITLSQFVELTATTPAKLFGMYPRKGTIALGSDADLVLWDPEKRVTLTNALMRHGADYTPYEGIEVVGYPKITFLRGMRIHESGEVIGPEGSGRYLARDEYDHLRPTGRIPTPFDPLLGCATGR